MLIGTNNAIGRDSRFPPKDDVTCLQCFDEATGKFLWQYSSPRMKKEEGQSDWPLHRICLVPIVEGDRVWLVTNRYEVVCLDLNGHRDNADDGLPEPEASAPGAESADVVWRSDLFKTLGVRPQQAACVTPTIAGNLLLLNSPNDVDESPQKLATSGAPAFLAFDKTSGQLVWSDKTPTSNIHCDGCSAGVPIAPAAALIDGTWQAIFAGYDGWLYAFDLEAIQRGETQLLWKFDLNPKTAKLWLERGIANTPVVVGHRVYAAVGHNADRGSEPGRLWCIDATKRGDLSSDLVYNKSAPDVVIPHKQVAVEPDKGDFTRPNPHSGVVWVYASDDLNQNGKIEYDERMHHSNSLPAIHDGLLMTTDLNGIFHCLDAATGKLLWSHDLLGASDSGPLIAEGKAWVIDDDGDLLIFALSREKQLLAEHHLDSLGYTNLAAANETLYLATKSQLVAIGVVPKAEPLVAKLPGGLEVELVGVTKNFAPSKEGWKPDGSPIGEIDEWSSRIVVNRKGLHSSLTDDGMFVPAARDLLVEMRGLQSQPAIDLLDIQATKGWGHIPHADPYRNRLSLLLNKPSDTLTFRMAISDAPWGPYQQVGLDGKLLNELDLASPEAEHYSQIRVIRCGPHPDHPEQSEVTLELPDNYHERYSFAIHAIDTEGNDMLDIPDIESDNSGKVTAKYRTDSGLPGKIARWEYRLRPYQHFITFENVSLEPGKVTEPKVSVEAIEPEAAASSDKPLYLHWLSPALPNSGDTRVHQPHLIATQQVTPGQPFDLLITYGSETNHRHIDGMVQLRDGKYIARFDAAYRTSVYRFRGELSLDTVYDGEALAFSGAVHPTQCVLSTEREAKKFLDSLTDPKRLKQLPKPIEGIDWEADPTAGIKPLSLHLFSEKLDGQSTNHILTTRVVSGTPIDIVVEGLDPLLRGKLETRGDSLYADFFAQPFNGGHYQGAYERDEPFGPKIFNIEGNMVVPFAFLVSENPDPELWKEMRPLHVNFSEVNLLEVMKAPTKATLPGGLELELLGVTPFREAFQEGWTPQGVKFEKAPEWATGLKVNPLSPALNDTGVETNDAYRDFIVRARGFTKEQQALLPFSGQTFESGVSTVGRMQVLTWNQQVQRLRIGIPGEWGPYRVLTVDPKVAPKAKAVEVPAEVPVPFRKVYDSIQPVIDKGPPINVWLPRLEGDNGRNEEDDLKEGRYTRIAWKGQPTNPDLKYTTIEAVLVDLQGQRHTTTGTTNIQDGQSQWDVDLFPVPFDQVSHVEYRLRPYQHVVTFNNVALHPGVACGPNVVVESPLAAANNPPAPLEFREVAAAPVKEPVEYAGQKWFPIAGEVAPDSAGKPVVDKSALGLPVERLNEGKEHMGLVGDTPATSIPWDGTWHVEKCEVQPDPNSEDRYVIRVTLDAPGGKALRTLTTSAMRQRLAVLVEERILVAPTIQESFGIMFDITGNFTKEQAEELAKSIRRGMAPTVGQSSSTGQPTAGSWGPAKNGVRSRITLLDSKPHVGSAKVRVELLNEGDVPQEFFLDPRKAGKAFVIQTLDGKQVWRAIENLPVTDAHNSDKPITIPPGKSVTLLDEFDLGYAFFFEKPAEYLLRFGGDCEFPGVVSEHFPESNTLTVGLSDGPRSEIQRIGQMLRSDHHISENSGFHWGGAWAVDDHTFVFRRLDYVNVHQVTLQFTDSVEPAPLYVPEFPENVPTPKARDVLLGKTKLGYAHLQIPELADKEWPKCEEQIRERLGKELAPVGAVSATPPSRTVTLSFKDKPLRETLAAVAEQVGLKLEIDEAALVTAEFDLNRPVTAEFQDEPLEYAVALICDFPYVISSGAILPLRGETLVLTTMEAETQRQAAATPDWLRPLLDRGVHTWLNDAGEVTYLTFSQEALTDELLQRLPELQHLKSIGFDPRCPATVTGLAQLAKIKALDSIELTGGRADVYRVDQILSVLKSIPTLKTLSLTETGVTDAGVAHLEEMNALERLTVHQEGRITDRAVDTIATMTQLKSLTLTQYVATEYFGKMAFSAESLRGLSRLKNLEHLNMIGIPVPGELIDFPQLRSLGLTGNEIDDRVAARIAQCHQLTSLTLSETRITDAGFKLIAGGPKLISLSLTNSPITDLGISHLVTLPLQHLELRGAKLTSVAYEHLAKIPTLQRIDINNTGSRMTIDGIQALKAAPHLRTLRITGFPHDANYFALGELKQLRDLHFWMSLTQLQHLEFLKRELSHTRVSAVGEYISEDGRIDRRAQETPPDLVKPIGNDTEFPKFYGERSEE